MTLVAILSILALARANSGRRLVLEFLSASADLNADILDGHLSSGLCHTGAISHQVGRKASAKEIASTLDAYPLLASSFDRMVNHLKANKISVDDSVITLGPWLDMDPQTEQFTNHDDANSLLTREYRPGFAVPEIG